MVTSIGWSSKNCFLVGIRLEVFHPTDVGLYFSLSLFGVALKFALEIERLMTDSAKVL